MHVAALEQAAADAADLLAQAVLVRHDRATIGSALAPVRSSAQRPGRRRTAGGFTCRV